MKSSQEVLRTLKAIDESLIPFLFTEFMGGQVHELTSIPDQMSFSVNDLLLLDGVSDSDLLALGRKTSAAIYSARASEFSEGRLTSKDWARFKSLGLPALKDESGLESEDYFMDRGGDFAGNECRPAVFLDRDGTLIDLVPYVKDPQFVRLMSGVVPFLKQAVRQGYRLVCVTNQSGLGRDYYNLQDFHNVQNRMHELLAVESVRLDVSFFAGYFGKTEDLRWAGRSSLRKPRPGMLVEAARRLNIDLASSIMVGDSIVDMKVAGAAGLRAAYQIRGTDKCAPSYHECPVSSVSEFDQISI